MYILIIFVLSPLHFPMPTPLYFPSNFVSFFTPPSRPIWASQISLNVRPSIGLWLSHVVRDNCPFPFKQLTTANSSLALGGTSCLRFSMGSASTGLVLAVRTTVSFFVCVCAGALLCKKTWQSSIPLALTLFHNNP